MASDDLEPLTDECQHLKVGQNAKSNILMQLKDNFICDYMIALHRINTGHPCYSLLDDTQVFLTKFNECLIDLDL